MFSFFDELNNKRFWSQDIHQGHLSVQYIASLAFDALDLFLFDCFTLISVFFADCIEQQKRGTVWKDKQLLYSVLFPFFVPLNHTNTQHNCKKGSINYGLGWFWTQNMAGSGRMGSLTVIWDGLLVSLQIGKKFKNLCSNPLQQWPAEIWD